MRVGLITAEPEHPLLAATTALLTPRHRVEAVDPGGWDGAPEDPDSFGALADVYLLKARTPRALGLARYLAERGAPVLNAAGPTELCQDRTAMADLALRAGLPFAPTRTVPALARLGGEELIYPVVIKSRHSRRHDLVARVDDAAGLRDLCGIWSGEPVVVQPFTENSGWDHKLWVIEGRVFAAVRRSELADSDPAPDRGPAQSLAPGELPDGWARLALRVGSVFGLRVYGVDVIDAGGGVPLIVDINAFPGIRGQAGAPEALAELALRTAERGAAPDS
ncbi:ATP-grasp domain-containing protein [Streptomyces milbemycinicus]|uniref:ATP-grasp domain-containing protein n=1 Tax=Streptomyces milbemycinicus TaxID=476552 RepID=UPI0033F9E1B0